MKLKVLSKALICRIDLNNANHGNTSYGVPPFFIGSDTPILDVVLISDLTVSMDRFRLNLTGSYERKADVGHNFCASPLQTISGRSGLLHWISVTGQKRE